MKFVVDENISFGLVEALRKNREEVLAIVEDNRGISDIAVFNLAQKDKAILITRDYYFANPVRFASSKAGEKSRQGTVRTKGRISLELPSLK